MKEPIEIVNDELQFAKHRISTLENILRIIVTHYLGHTWEIDRQTLEVWLSDLKIKK